MANDTDATNKSDPQGELVEILSTAKINLGNIDELARAAKITIDESQRLSSESLALLQAKITTAASAASEVSLFQTKAIDAQKVIALKSDHIQAAQEHADKVRADLERTRTEAMQQASAAEGHKTKAQAEAETANKLTTDIRTRKGAVDTDAAAVAAAKKLAEDSALVAKGLADKAQSVEKNVTAYEARLAQLEKQCIDQLVTIEKLLPGATSSHLASSFNDRRLTFLKPHNMWQGVFVGSVLALVFLGYRGLGHLLESPLPLSPTLIALHWMIRLPVAGALIWLARHASRESALAKRLEEDYGYKAAMSACFEGFKKQVADVGSGIAPDSALAKLLNNTLEIIATPPGRIYDKHELDVSPTKELTEAARALAEAAKAIKPTLVS